MFLVGDGAAEVIFLGRQLVRQVSVEFERFSVIGRHRELVFDPCVKKLKWVVTRRQSG